MRTATRTGLALALGALAWLSAAGAARADLIYNVTMNTSALTAPPDSANAPFSVGFSLADGTFAGDGNNTVKISNISIVGGSAVGSPTLLGGASGSLTTGVTLTDNAVPTQFTQTFTPGTTLSFKVTTTTNVGPGEDPTMGGTPDHFGFFITDMTGNPIATTGTMDPNSFFDFDITSALGTGPGGLNGTESNPSAPSGSYPVTIPAPVVTFGGTTGGGGGGGAAVPEPATLALLAVGLGGLAARRVWRRGRASA